MSTSTVTLQSQADLMLTMGSAAVAQSAGGFTTLTWCALGNAVLNDLISQKFNWKWNSVKLAAFLTTSYQTDYATVNQMGIGWLENGTWTDINNTSLPKPRWPIDCIREQQPTAICASPPRRVNVQANSTLEQGVWPGAGMIYLNPLGAYSTPQNPRTNILDAHGNILILTTYGTTGATAPDAGGSAQPGATVEDGGCVWTVANPNAQGFRVTPMPPATGVAYQIDLIAQMAAPRFTTMNQTIAPVADDYAETFQAGMYVYCHKYSPDPAMKRDFMNLRMLWLKELQDSVKQGDREDEDAGFLPSRSVMGNGDCGDVGPANPYGSGWPGTGR